MKEQQDRYQDSLERLVDLLDTVVHEQVGSSLAEVMRRIRRFAGERRAGLPDAESRLNAELRRLKRPQLRSVIRWLSLFFDLANSVEDLRRVEVLQDRDRRAQAAGAARQESIASTIEELKQAGTTSAELQEWLSRLKIEPVFTAHPSEAKRRTTRQLLRQIREQLPSLRAGDSDAVEQRLLADMTVLWQSDLVRPQRPPVMSEVSRGVFFAETLWDVVPDIYRQLRSALNAAYPQHPFDIPRFLSFGTWIGGDRDGHPFVTADITRRTLARLKRAGLENHLARCREMLRQLVMSDLQVPAADPLREEIRAAAERWPLFARRLESLSEFETSRRFVKLIELRLEQTLEYVAGQAETPARYVSAGEFRDDLTLLRESIAQNRGQRIAVEIVQPWLDQFDTFGFHFAALDIRQNSECHRQCVNEILDQLGLASEDLDVAPSAAVSGFTEHLDPDKLSAESREVVDTFLLLADEVAEWGLKTLGGYVISMTHSARDVLSVHWLWTAAWRTRQGDEPLPALPIIPLFETIDDLQRAEAVMEDLYQIPEYVEYLTSDNVRRQTVMVGYSDSTKDGGYLSACWELHQAQQKLADVADRYDVELTIFHGRGGALGRGGGPAARAIQSLPPKAVGGRLRVTEQGEVLAERYDDPRIAHRHLEQILNATLLVSTKSDEGLDSDWTAAMSQMSARSLEKYRSLVQHPGFLSYFDLATPISVIETLPIGSRPARRGQRTALTDLRAIPWTFAWTQSRHLLPAWFGFGTAVRDYVDDHDGDWSLLRDMYERWPVFRALVDNAELALAKADMRIARNYAELSREPSAEEIWELISSEFDRSRGAVLFVSDRHELLSGTEWLRRSIQIRNPYVDPLNLAQVHLLEIERTGADDPEVRDLLRLSIQGIASGLRTTG